MATDIDLDLVLDDFSQETVMLVIGADMLTWFVERKVLERSSHFRTMLERQWLKRKPRILELPHTDTIALRAYLSFLTTNQVPDLGCDTLADLYVFGQSISDSGFKNAVLDAMTTRVQGTTMDGCTLIPSKLAVNAIYDATAGEALGRKLMVDIYYHFAEPDTDAAWVEYHVDFRRDMAMRYLEDNKSNAALLASLVSLRLEENQRARSSGRRTSWDVTRFNYHEGFSHDAIDQGCTREGKEEKHFDLAMSCRDIASSPPAKNGLATVISVDAWANEAANWSDLHEKSLPTKVDEKYSLPGTYFYTGA